VKKDGSILIIQPTLTIISGHYICHLEI